MNEYISRVEIYARLTEAAARREAAGKAAFDEGDTTNALAETFAAAGLREFRDNLEKAFKDAPWN